MVSRLLGTAVADIDPTVRLSVINALSQPSSTFHAFLAQADALRTLFVALNDESPRIRASAMCLVGQMAPRNAAYVLPALRLHLLQLLTDLEHGTESPVREEAATLLAVLAQSCTRLILPYVSPLLRSLIAKLRAEPEKNLLRGNPAGGSEGASTASAERSEPVTLAAAPLQPPRENKTGPNPVVAVVSSNWTSSAERASVISTIGVLADVAGDAIVPFARELLPVLVGALKDGAGGGGAARIRDAAIVTIGQVAEATIGRGVAPLEIFPTLLDQLLKLLSETQSGRARREILRTVGVLGALDPHMHKLSQEKARARGRAGAAGQGQTKGH